MKGDSEVLQITRKPRFSGYNLKRIINILLGPLLFFAILIYPLQGVSYHAKEGLGLLLWMIAWWIMRPVHAGVTALLPISITAIFQIVPMETVLYKYASPIVILLLGANILTVSWQKWGLDKRIALLVLLKVGSDVKKQIIVWFALAAVLSSIIPNTIVATALIPIAVATLSAVGIKNSEDYRKSEYATGVLLALAWGSSIGFVTPLGGAMNLVVIQFVEDMFLHHEFMFITWIVNMLPLFFAVSIPLLLVILNFPYEFKQIPNGNVIFRNEYKLLGKIKTGEKWGAVLFAIAVILSFLRPLYVSILPELHPAYIFLTAAIITFLINVEGNQRMLTWKYTQPKLMWGMYYLFAGGTALGEILSKSGGADILVELIMPLANKGVLGAIMAFAVLAGVLSNIMTITGSMSIVIPLLISTLTQLGLNPLPLVYIVSAAGNVSIMLPSSSGGPAIVAGYGIDLAKMARRGAKAAAIAITSAIVVGYLLVCYWPGYLP